MSSGNIWRSCVFAFRRFEFAHDFDNAGAALDGIVQMKDKMWRVFQHDVAGQLGLQRRALRLQLVHNRATIFRAEHTNKDVRVLEIGRYVHMVNSNDS